MRHKSIQHTVEYLLTAGFYGTMRLLPLPVASAFGGYAARAIGPFIRRTRLARRQMQQHLPSVSEAGSKKIAADMWENLGRTFAEYPHMHRRAMAERITIEGGEILQQLKAQGRNFLVISGHIGNWEVLPRACSMLSAPAHVIYRPPNNPLTHRLIDTIRSRYSLGHYGKGLEGARGVMDAMKKGEPVAMLIDQKDNQGASLAFLGSPAMTMTSAAKMALKYGVAVVPCFIERTQGAHFNAIFLPPLEAPPESADSEARALGFMQAMNDTLSSWIAAHPAQWFWLHRRWPKEAA